MKNHIESRRQRNRTMPVANITGAQEIELFIYIYIYIYAMQEIRTRGYKDFSCSTQLSTKIIMLLNVKMLTIVCILTFISMIHTLGVCKMQG